MANTNLLVREALCFDDVLLVPKYTEVASRKTVDISTQIASRVLRTPIISANMNTVTNLTMFLAMREAGGYGYIHRFLDIEDRTTIAKHESHPPMSIGIGMDEVEAAKAFVDVGCTDLCIDIAHGHCKAMMDTLDYLRKELPSYIHICAGNIVTASAAEDLVNAGVNAVKIGIGPGQVCTTRVVTGHGFPQLSAIAQVSNYRALTNYKFHIVADGGVRNSGDIVKALAAGADSVMLGGLLAGCIESAAPTVNVEGRLMKLYAGMASIKAQQDRPGNHRVRAAEGVSAHIEITGPVGTILGELAEGIQSGCSYSGALNLEELRKNAEFVKVTPTSLMESKPRV